MIDEFLEIFHNRIANIEKPIKTLQLSKSDFRKYNNNLLIIVIESFYLRRTGKKVIVCDYLKIVM